MVLSDQDPLNMAVVVSANGNGPAFEAKMTVYVFVCVLIAAVGGLIFGYDIGISGLFSFSVLFFTLLVSQGNRTPKTRNCVSC